MRIKFIIFLVIYFVTFSIKAQLDDDIKKCSLIKDQKDRLVCFDSLAKSLNESSKTEIESPIKEITIIKEQAPVIKEEDAVEEIPLKTSKEIIEDQREIISSLKKRITGISKARERDSESSSFSAKLISVEYRSYKFRFELDNGQVWQLTDTGSRAKLKKGQKVMMEPGSMGSFFLTNSKGRFRTKRIK